MPVLLAAIEWCGDRHTPGANKMISRWQSFRSGDDDDAYQVYDESRKLNLQHMNKLFLPDSTSPTPFSHREDTTQKKARLVRYVPP